MLLLLLLLLVVAGVCVCVCVSCSGQGYCGFTSVKISQSDRREVRPLRAWLLCNKGKLTGGKFKGIKELQRNPRLGDPRLNTN